MKSTILTTKWQRYLPMVLVIVMTTMSSSVFAQSYLDGSESFTEIETATPDKTLYIRGNATNPARILRLTSENTTGFFGGFEIYKKHPTTPGNNHNAHSIMRLYGDSAGVHLNSGSRDVWDWNSSTNKFEINFTTNFGQDIDVTGNIKTAGHLDLNGTVLSATNLNNLLTGNFGSNDLITSGNLVLGPGTLTGAQLEGWTSGDFSSLPGVLFNQITSEGDITITSSSKFIGPSAELGSASIDVLTANSVTSGQLQLGSTLITEAALASLLDYAGGSASHAAFEVTGDNDHTTFDTRFHGSVIIHGNDGENDPTFTPTDADYSLYIEEGLHAGDINIGNVEDWPDYVFDEQYALLDLQQVSDFIKSNKHLPGIPSADELEKEKHYNLHKMNTVFLQKIEELTLYILEQEERVSKLEKQLSKTN